MAKTCGTITVSFIKIGTTLGDSGDSAASQAYASLLLVACSKTMIQLPSRTKNLQSAPTVAQAYRVKAIELAAELGLLAIPDCKLSINFLPNAVYRAETCIRATLEAAKQANFPLDRLMFEVTEGERVDEPEHLKSIFEEYDRQGFTTAIDDFGSGYSGLNLLATFQPKVLKIDMALTRGIDQDSVRQAIVEAIVLVAKRLGIVLIAEGIETREESATPLGLGIDLMQGYLFARPLLEALPLVSFDGGDSVLRMTS